MDKKNGLEVVPGFALLVRSMVADAFLGVGSTRFQGQLSPQCPPRCPPFFPSPKGQGEPGFAGPAGSEPSPGSRVAPVDSSAEGGGDCLPRFVLPWPLDLWAWSAPQCGRSTACSLPQEAVSVDWTKEDPPVGAGLHGWCRVTLNVILRRQWKYFIENLLTMSALKF